MLSCLLLLPWWFWSSGGGVGALRSSSRLTRSGVAHDLIVRRVGRCRWLLADRFRHRGSWKSPPMTTSAPFPPSTRSQLPELWKRSLIAIFGLGLSFAAALFSTVTRESGNVAATAVLAGTSLLVSVWVGMTTVPYLARRVVSG